MNVLHFLYDPINFKYKVPSAYEMAFVELSCTITLGRIRHKGLYIWC
jgi:hypothetical protein